MVIFYKRLDRGRYQIPEAPHADVRHVEVDDATLEALLDGIDVEQDSKTRSPSKTH